MTFTDLLCSCDVIVGKPGYGTFTEAVCNGKPVLYVERVDWPEEACLVKWLLEYGNGLTISRKALETGTLRPALQHLARQPAKPPPVPMGIVEAADCLMCYLTQR
jgi:UDP-N-acetylglucosamine:LPS N-acetylglucosamine transferase